MTLRDLLPAVVLVLASMIVVIDGVNGEPVVLQPAAGPGPIPAGADRPSPDRPQLIGNNRNVIDVKFMLRGYCRAGSRIRDPQALGGFAGSDNYAQPIRTDAARAAKACYLLAQPNVGMPFGERQGMRLVLVNPTDEAIPFTASDSRLSIVQEALHDGVWKPIEFLPGSFCGNSYHRVFLGSMQYWSFAAPRYMGTIETKLRFRLELANGRDILSNEFDGSINLGQVSVKQP